MRGHGAAPRAHRPDRPAPGAWAPLGIPLFRALWLAELTGDLGNWMQTVAAQWLLVDRADAVLLVALVVAAQRLPSLLLAVPLGALADFVDRRRLLIATESFQAAVGTALAVTTLLRGTGPAALLTYTFLLGLGSALSIVAFQSLVPELVPRRQLPSAVALAGVNLNIARVVGPAVGGLIVAAAGPAAVFALNACSFLAFVLVLLVFEVPKTAPSGPATSYPEAVRAGLRYVRGSGALRRILLRSVLFAVPFSALWALLPLVTGDRLGLGATGYGLLLTCIGAGAVAGAALLPRLRRALAPNPLILAGSLGAGAAFATLALVGNAWVVAPVLFLAGLAWLVVQMSLNTAMQMAAPGRVRARVLAVYQGVTLGGQSLAALGWGLAAQSAGLVPAVLLSGAAITAGGATVAWWPLGPESSSAPDPTVRDPPSRTADASGVGWRARGR
jgi:MFS family permease